jgi:hypothetical protein
MDKTDERAQETGEKKKGFLVEMEEPTQFLFLFLSYKEMSY